jgi:hypothetical protein
MSRHTLRLFFPDATADGSHVRAAVDLGRAGIHEVYFKSDGGKLAPNGNALYCLGLPAAMQLGWDLLIDAKVDAALIENSEAIQRFYTTWYPDFSRVRVEAGVEDNPFAPGTARGLFFSGGVDSFYSALTERENLDLLVTVIGADVAPGNAEGVRQLTGLARSVAQAWGIRAITVSTNLREVFNGLVGWEEFHGAALAAIRHLLAREIGTQLIASTAGEASWARGWGSHPGLDPLFGTPAAQIIHHGLVGRTDKIKALTAEPLALEKLRVCFHRHDGRNCGHCQKCIYAIEALDVFGALDRAPTFPFKAGRLPLKCTGRGNEGDLVNLLEHCTASGRRPDLVIGIGRALRSFRRYELIRQSAQRLKRHVKRWRRRLRLERLGRLKSHALPGSSESATRG